MTKLIYRGVEIVHNGDEWWVMDPDGIEIRDVFLYEEDAKNAIDQWKREQRKQE